MARKGHIYDENFDSNSPQSLEDMLKGEEETVEEVVEDIESKNEKTESKDEDSEPVEDKIPEEEKTETAVEDDDSDEEVTPEVTETAEEDDDGQDDETSEDISDDNSSEETVQTPQKIQVQKEHIEEVKKIVDKNPRITLWSSRSSAVFRYLRKTEPEFSISKEASVLIEEAVAKKYPEIWALFDDY